MKYLSIFFLFCLAAASCVDSKPKTLPILGNRDVVNGDTIYPQIPDFAFINQDSQIVNNATFQGKIYISDFFFIHCPTICPKVKAQALRVYEKYKDNPKVMLLSHSIDVKNDTVGALKTYANKLGIRTEKWHLVTGNRDAIYEIADDYFSVAKEDSDAPGGFDHSGLLILVDEKRHVRSFADGTNPEEVTRFLLDIDVLLAEK